MSKLKSYFEQFLDLSKELNYYNSGEEESIIELIVLKSDNTFIDKAKELEQIFDIFVDVYGDALFCKRFDSNSDKIHTFSLEKRIISNIK
jgi:hypothetical protein